MCGILGINFTGRRDDAIYAVERGLSVIRHRGPDDRDVVVIHGAGTDQHLVFGHQRLSIIDLSEGGHQPMRDPETGNWITYNGEVYNYLELRRELEGLGSRFRSSSDTEVLLQSYRVWGKECVQRWRGMFALAIWDDEQKELFLVRDRLGIKPIYYWQRAEGKEQRSGSNGGSFVFGSEVRALLATGLIDPKLSVTAVDTFLMFGAVQDPLTIIEGVKSLPAGHTLTVKDGKTILNEYWDCLPVDSPATAAASDIPATLADAVRLRLISDVPLGVFLSGGIDSSAVAMLAQASSADPVKTFTIGFEEASFDEAEVALATAKQLGVQHHPIVLTGAEMLSSCEQAIAALDQPSIDGVNTFHVSRAVKNAGMTVALSGLGGDEVFCGYEHFKTVPKHEANLARWSKAPYLLRSVASSLIPNGTQRSAKLRALVLNDYGFPHPYFLSRTLFVPDQIASLLTPDAVRTIDYGDWGQGMNALLTRAESLDPINRLSYFELKTYVANTLLRDTDVMSMAHSLEVRVPLLDHELVEHALRLPGKLKFDGKSKKPLLVSSLPHSLPRQITEGRKRGFVLPYEKWLKGELRSQVETSLLNQPKELSGVINSESVQQVWQSFLNGKTSWTRPWSLFVLNEVVRKLESSLSLWERVGERDVVSAN
jgi:asparagine synthase (glutamine-hydrolysing)